MIKQNQKFIAKIFIALIIILSTGFQINGVVFAQGKVSLNKINFVKNPDITIRDVTINQKGGKAIKKITGDFTIYNLEPRYHGDLYYEVSLVRVKDDNRDINSPSNQLVVYSSFPEGSPIHLDQGLHKVFNYTLNVPKNIWGGLFLVKINLYLGSGMLISSGQAPIDLNRRGSFLEITDETTNPIVKKGDKAYFTLGALSSNTKDVNVRANINIYKETRFGKLEKNFKSDQFKISAGDKIKKDFELGNLKAGLYSFSSQLLDKNNIPVSNIIFGKFLVEGENALLRISEINPNKLAYAKGDTAKIDIRVSSLQKSAQNAPEVNLTVKIINVERNKVVGEKTEKVFIPGAERMVSVGIPIKENLGKYRIATTISYNGNILNQRNFQNFSTGKNNEAKVINVENIDKRSLVKNSGSKINSWKYLILAGIILVLAILAGIGFIGFKKFKASGKNSRGKGPRSLLFLLFFMSSAVIFSMFLNVGNAQANGTLKICVYGKLFDTNKGVYNKLLPSVNIYWNGSSANSYLGHQNGCYTISGPAGTYKGTITASKPSYSYDGVNYHFYNSSHDNFTLHDGWTTRVNIYLTAKNGSVKFYTYNCTDNSAIGNATVHYESYTVNTNNNGYYTLNGVYPGVFRYLYASKNGYSNSDAKLVKISSERLSNLSLCLKPSVGSVTGRVTVCGSPSQGIAKADMLYKGNLLVNDLTDNNGYYTFKKVAAGTYNNISFGGVSGFHNSASQTVVVKPNTTTIANFCLNPNFNSLGYSWFPADGTNYYGFLGTINYKFFINNSTLFTYKNATVKFLYEGTVVSTITKDVNMLKTTEFDYDYLSFIKFPGSHKIGAQVYWNGSQILSEERTINVKTLGGGFLSGQVTDCKDKTKISSARVTQGTNFVNTNSSGIYSMRLPVGTYNGVYASKTGYEDSVSQSVSIKANTTTNANFCMNKQTGSLIVRVLDRSNHPVNNASIFWDDPSAGANNIFLGKTNANGFISGVNLPVGTYHGIYASIGTNKSTKETVTINANSTTRLNLIVSPPSSTPTLNVSFNANPSLGKAPLNVKLTTSVGGTAVGVITYSNQHCGSGGTISNINGGSFNCLYNSPGNYTAGIRVQREGITKTATNNITVSGNSYLDIGLRYYDGSKIVGIAAEKALSSPLRIYKNGKIYGIALVNINDPKASKIRVKTLGGIKALRKL